MALNKKIITIDGPSGSGKSTVARALASRLGCRYLDTGAMYRAVALAVIQAGVEVDPPEGQKVAALMRACSLTLDQDGKVLLEGACVEDQIRRDPVTNIVSAVSACRAVRTMLVDLQRKFAEEGCLVAEGRDLGSVVFPDAAFKFYIDAEPVERARRRAEQLKQSGAGSGTEEEILRNQERRDSLDTRRSLSPLALAPDMIKVDTTSLSLEEVVKKLLCRIQD